MNKKVFFSILEIIYGDIKIHNPESDQYFGVKDALNVYQLVDEIIPVLLLGNKNNQDILEGCLKRSDAKKLIDALRQVKVFPELNFHHLNQNKFFELRKFLEFIKHIQLKPKIYRKGQNISLIDQSSKCWKLDHEDYAQEFLKEYLLYRYENQYAQPSYIKQYELAVQSFSNKQDQVIDEFKLYVKQDIESLVKQVGLLYIVVAKVTFKAQDKSTSNFSKILNRKFKLLDCLKTTTGVIRIIYKPFRMTEDILEYYAVFFVQSESGLNEVKLLEEVSANLSESIRNQQDILVETIVQNMNTVFRKVFFPSLLSKHFLIVDQTEGTLNFTTKCLLEFLYYLECFCEIELRSLEAKDLDKSQGSVRILTQLQYHDTNTIDLKIRYLTANSVQYIPHLLFFGSKQRAKSIWDTGHFPTNIREYIKRISVIYQENLTSWGMQEYFDLVMQIEIFMMTLRETPYNAFYPVDENVRGVFVRKNLDIENNITRQLLQFAVLLRNQDRLNSLRHKLTNKTISKILKYFFSVYTRQLKSDVDALVLQIFLGVRLDENKFRIQIDTIIAEYRFSSDLFFKPKPYENDGEDISQSESIATSEQPVEIPHKLIHIQRHVSRLLKVQDMLKSAMKNDVIIIRCLFYCNASFQLTYKDHSRIFSTMLQDNKKRKPISEINIYLGYWEARTRNAQNKILDYAANVVFMIKAQVLMQCPNLLSELEKAWTSACRKVSQEYGADVKIQGIVQELKISSSLDVLRCNQLLIETTQKKLTKDIVEYLATYVVYQDLLDDDIYQDLPKWLIKKNGPSKKRGTKKPVITIT
ncbi:hypothetical protein ACX1NX_01500 [Acinetobacter sp. ANC 5383]